MALQNRSLSPKMKRTATTTDFEDDYRPAKRGRIATPSTTGTDGREGSVFDSDPESLDNGSITAAPTPMTSFSGMSPPTRKFPSDLKTIKCTWPGCPKTFNRPARLTAHLRSHNNERPFVCEYAGCDKSYIEEKHLKQHIKGTHTQERDFTCAEPDCGKSFTTSTRLRRHQLVHEGQERYRCRDHPPCNQSFRKHQTLQRHIRSEHLNEPAFACTQTDVGTNKPCEAAFDTANALKRHIERDHGEARFWCEECGTKPDSERIGFPTMELLQRHMHNAHIGCMFCERTFASKEGLEVHIDAEHAKAAMNDRKSVACTWPGCDKTFVKKSNLNVHVRSVHEGLRYVCGEVDLSGTDGLGTWKNEHGCERGFVTKANLEDHVRHVHMGIPRPRAKQAAAKAEAKASADMLGIVSGRTERTRHTVPCTMAGCTFKFTSQGDLQAHVRSYHGPPPQPQSVEVDPTILALADFGDASTQPSTHTSTHTSTTPTPVLHTPESYGPPVLPPLDALPRPHMPAHLEGYWQPMQVQYEPAHFEPSPYPEIVEDHWRHDDVDMRQLIGYNELEGFIDPALEQM